MNIEIYKNCENLNIYNISTSYDNIDDIIKSFAFYLNIPKGNFSLDYTVGSNFLLKLKQELPSLTNQKLELILKEEATAYPYININSAEYNVNLKTNSITLFITLSAKQNIYYINLEVQHDIF